MGRFIKRAAALVALFVLASAAAPRAAGAGADGCQAPRPVCAARSRVFAIASFDPLASAVLVAPGLLVTNRHVVVDSGSAMVRLGGGRVLRASVVPTSYAGDLVLLEAPGLTGPPALATAAADADSRLFTVGTDIPGGTVRVYAPGRMVLPPAPDKPLARLHHTAHGQPGNSGGALVDGLGRLVGIVTSGGEGYHEAIPATEIARLRAQSGPGHATRSRAIGAAYRRCALALEAVRTQRRSGGEDRLDAMGSACAASNNRQFLDLAAQAFGRARRLDEAAALFARALEQDPGAVNSRIGMAMALNFARRHAEAVPHVERLLDVLPADARVLNMAVQAGRLGGSPDLTRRGLAGLERHHPRMVAPARRFLELAPQ